MWCVPLTESTGTSASLTGTTAVGHQGPASLLTPTPGSLSPRPWEPPQPGAGRPFAAGPGVTRRDPGAEWMERTSLESLPRLTFLGGSAFLSLCFRKSAVRGGCQGRPDPVSVLKRCLLFGSTRG